eukprot:TRINITY_DN10363_c0_g1_i1.p1 TRINITY_DN10363_c0_g1~~TRINITY_DN10363_c0_g1_i1.p1  ORF type:complete len:452 (+),score=53.42 TRINITY_DN10363_c0_g1_i1:104-1459(+)
MQATRAALAHSAPWMKGSKFVKPRAAAPQHGIELLLTGTLHGVRCPGWTRLKITCKGFLEDPADRAVAAACGMNHAAVVTASGGVLTFGDNRQGQCGRPLAHGVYGGGDATAMYFPPRAAGEEVDAVALGARHTFVYRKGSRQVRVAGQNEFHQLGLGLDYHHDIADVADEWGHRFGLDWERVWEAIPEEEGGVVKISTGATHTLMLLESGAVYAFGCALDGALGTGNTLARNTPFRLKFFAAQGIAVTDVVAGHACSFFLTDNGVYGCGKRDEGRLGLPWTRQKPVSLLPTKIPLPTDPVLLDGGLAHGVLANENGWWIIGGSQKLGLSSLMCKDTADIVHRKSNTPHPHYTSQPHIPRPLPPPPSPLVSVACGSHHTLALTTDGRVLGSGFGADGQLGNGLPDAIGASHELLRNPSTAAVAAGGNFSVVAINVDEGTSDTWSHLPSLAI